MKTRFAIFDVFADEQSAICLNGAYLSNARVVELLRLTEKFAKLVDDPPLFGAQDSFREECKTLVARYMELVH